MGVSGARRSSKIVISKSELSRKLARLLGSVEGQTEFCEQTKKMQIIPTP